MNFKKNKILMDDRSMWHDWFAWYPIIIKRKKDDSGWAFSLVWLGVVERKGDVNGYSRSIFLNKRRVKFTWKYRVK